MILSLKALSLEGSWITISPLSTFHAASNARILNVLISIAMTGAFVVLTDHLFNERSPYCIIPGHLRNYEELLDDDKDGHVTSEEVENAKRVLEKNKKKNRKVNHLRQLEAFRSKLIY